MTHPAGQTLRPVAWLHCCASTRALETPGFVFPKEGKESFPLMDGLLEGSLMGWGQEKSFEAMKKSARFYFLWISQLLRREVEDGDAPCPAGRSSASCTLYKMLLSEEGVANAARCKTLPQGAVCEQRRGGCCGAWLAQQGAPAGARALARRGNVTVLPPDARLLDSWQSCCLSLGKVKRGPPATLQTWHLG